MTAEYVQSDGGWLATDTAAPVPEFTGPASPLPWLTAEPALPVVANPRLAELWIVGAHGGAGESTLADLVDTWQAAGHAWPQGTQPVSCVLTARTSVGGLLAAQSALRQWAAGDAPVHLHGLVLIADAPGGLPRALRDLAEVVAGGAPRCWLLPWSEAWRCGDPQMTRPVTQLIRELSAVIDTTRRSK